MRQKGFSLLEVMVVLTVFSFLAIIATQAILSTLRLSAKSSSTARVRSDVDFALSTIERHLHNAEEVVVCDGAETDTILYKDIRGVATTFSCENIGPDQDGYIASGSGRLTSTDISITACSMLCVLEAGTVPTSVTINLSAQDANKTGIEKAQVTTSTQIYLRTY